MLALIISIIVSAICIMAGKIAHFTPAAVIGSGITGLLIPQLTIGFIVRKKSKVINDLLQETILNGQKRINHKINQFQNKPGANPKQVQRLLEHDQHEIFKQALQITEKLEAFKKWNLLMGKQIATIRLQFLYQLKEFEQVDAIFSAGPLSSPMMMDPLPVAMKMARQYKKQDFAGAEKTFKKYVRWFRGSRSTLLYATLSWIYVKQGKTDEAFQLLLKGKEATGDDTLANNYIHLSNNKIKLFSNSGLGDEWYGLYLENPPAPKQKRVRANPKGRPF
jgi:tetratricopeptide (TPR) repeat protein